MLESTRCTEAGVAAAAAAGAAGAGDASKRLKGNKSVGDSFSSSRGSMRWRLRAGLRRAATTVRPEVPFVRGLSRRFEDMQSSRPQLYRFLALATLTVTFAATCGLQLSAPGLVDPSIGA